MYAAQLHLPKATVHQLLQAGSGDAALLHLYLESGNDPKNAATDLNLSPARLAQANAALRQLGLLPEKQSPMRMVGERPQYSETDVITALDRDRSFQHLYREVENRLARPLNTEELKILLGFVRYLGLDADVILLLVNHCIAKARKKGSHRNPSIRSIEKEAYRWAEQEIDTLEEAVAYMKRWEARNSRLGQLMEQLRITSRPLTPGEEKYANQWLDWGFDQEALAMAYERTCLNTGGFSWPYMNKILSRWQAQNLLTAEQIRTGDRGKAYDLRPSGQPGEAEREAIRRIMQEV